LALVLAGLVFPSSVLANEPLPLADPLVRLENAWTHRRFGTATEYSTVMRGGVPAVRAVGRTSASGLYREVRYNAADHPWLAWTWRVDRLQRGADIRVKAREDFAAAIFMIFGRPSTTNRNVPTLAYVWTSGQLPEGAIVDSPHFPGVVRSIVVRGAGGRLGRWSPERRNLIDDFRRAFGRDPPTTVEVIALFTDNDQTGEPVEAYYGAIRALSR
jgi:hypothetical protein